MRPPRVVHVTTTAISLDLLLGPQLRAFADAGFDVIGASAPDPHVDALAGLGVTHVPLEHATRAMAPRDDLRFAAELRRVFGELDADIVHTHNPKPGWFGRPAARWAGVPVIVNTVHGLYASPDAPLGTRAVVYGLERFAAMCSHAELVQNPEDVEVLRRLRVPEERITLLGNGIDLARFDRDRFSAEDVRRARTELGATGPDDVVVGLVGRLVREKGYAEVFEAAAILAATRPGVQVAVVGPDDLAKADGLDDADRATAAAAGVRFLGARDDVDRLYPGMDLYVLASHREGFPRSAMEAAAMGLPIVATDIRGCRQVVDHDRTGLLVPPHDAHALADGIRRLVDDGGVRARMGAAGQAKARAEFDDRRQVETTLEVYDQQLRRAGRRPVGAARPAGTGVGLRRATVEDATVLAELHVDRIGDGFLATLGPAFLAALYRRIARSRSSAAIVATEGTGRAQGRIVGFVTVTESTGRLYREFLTHEGPLAAVRDARRVAGHARSVVETLRYGTGGDTDLPTAELLSVAVHRDDGGRGIGGQLVAAAIEELDGRGVASARVVTAVDNAPARAMYRRAGFVDHGTTEVHGGVAQAVMVWTR